MTDPGEILLKGDFEKLTKASSLLEHSRRKVRPYEPAKNYSPDELEPYDALSDRFVRAVEVAVRLMRSLERFEFVELSDTYRDLLHRMEKLGLITEAALWLQMRDVRNRIVHDYTPNKIKAIYDDILSPFGEELLGFLIKAQSRIPRDK